MAANTLKCFLPMTGFLDTEIAPAIKPTSQNKGQNVDTKSRLNGRDLRYVSDITSKIQQTKGIKYFDSDDSMTLLNTRILHPIPTWHSLLLGCCFNVQFLNFYYNFVW